MRIRVLGLTLWAWCFLAFRAPAGELSVGAQAPPLEVSRWIKGGKVSRFEPGEVYVLDFWATWCGPCIKGFPELTRLQKKYADKGVTVIGMNVWEGDQGAVEPFVKARSDAMGFSVALDLVPPGAEVKGEKGGFNGKMAEAWMKAAGKNVIPTVFIVGRDGKIAWIGVPPDVGEPLERIVTGKWYGGAPDKELVVFPAPAPIPALRFALLPLDPDRTPGDAAPIYLRLRAEGGDAGLREASSKAMSWLRRPLRDFPTSEARTFLEHWSDQLKQIEYGAKRRTCEWNYTIPEQSEQLIKIQPTDTYEMARWSTLLALKARLEIGEGRCDQALRTIATGLAFNHHIAGGPFLLHPLTAAGGDQVMLDRIDELITLPDAPNLYWALTALPRPLVNFRSAMENESRLIERLVPELADIRRPRPEADWSSLLAKIAERMEGIRKMTSNTSSVKEAGKPISTDVARLKAELFPEARSYFARRQKADQAATLPMSDDKMIVLYIAGWYRERWDDVFKAYHVPYPEGQSLRAAAIARRQSETGHPLSLFSGLAPPVGRYHEIQAELDRRVAALRAVEAVRLFAAANDGRMPASLAAANVVPVPPDPVTGKPFQYARDGETATLVREGPPPSRLKVIYRIAPRG